MKVEKDFGKKREWLILTEEARWLLKRFRYEPVLFVPEFNVVKMRMTSGEDTKKPLQCLF